jgi:hypothetical protein
MADKRISGEGAIKGWATRRSNLERERDALNRLLFTQSEHLRIVLDALKPFAAAAQTAIDSQPGRHDKCAAWLKFTLGDLRHLISAVDSSIR